MSERCIGYGKYEGRCGRPASAPWTRLWCNRCDDLRRASVTRDLEGIADEMGMSVPWKGERDGN